MCKTHPIPQPLPQQAGKGSLPLSYVLGEGRPERSEGQDEGSASCKLATNP